MADNTLEIKKTPLWLNTYKASQDYRFIVHQGGS